MQFSIRAAQKTDAATILDLVKALADYERLSHEVSATAHHFEKHGFGKETLFHALIAENKNRKAVGFALYFFTFSTFLGQPTLKLEDLFVLPEYRGNGIGKKLLVTLAEIAAKKECGRMEWDVLDWNEPAIKFYESIGAKPLPDWITYRLLPADFQKLTMD